MDDAIRKEHLAADVPAADEEQCPPISGKDIVLQHPGEVCIAPVVHVVVGRTRHLAPIDRRVAKEDTITAIGGQCGVDRANVSEDPLVHRQEPDPADLSGVLPRSPKLVTADRRSRDVAIHHGLIGGIAEFNDDIVHSPGKPLVADQHRQERG